MTLFTLHVKLESNHRLRLVKYLSRMPEGSIHKKIASNSSLGSCWSHGLCGHMGCAYRDICFKMSKTDFFTIWLGWVFESILIHLKVISHSKFVIINSLEGNKSLYNWCVISNDECVTFKQTEHTHPKVRQE